MLRYRRALDTWLSEDLVGEAVEALLALAEQLGKPGMIVSRSLPECSGSGCRGTRASVGGRRLARPGDIG